MDLKDLKVELRPHIAKQKVSIGGVDTIVDVDHKQCYVMVNGKQVAWYCGTKDQPNKYLSFVEFFPDTVQAAIAGAVAKITGGVSTYSGPPPEEHEVASDDE